MRRGRNGKVGSGEGGMKGKGDMKITGEAKVEKMRREVDVT